MTELAASPGSLEHPGPGTVRHVGPGLRFGAVLVLACLPLLVSHCRLLWSRQGYQFSPLLPLGAVVLAIQRLRGLDRVAPGSRGACRALFALAWLLLTLGILLPSPWLGALAGLVLLGAATFGLGGAALYRRLLPAWALLALAVPLPSPLDSRLVAFLQHLSAGMVSCLLDGLRVWHNLDGNVLELGGRRIGVEEACSGIRSLLAVLACTLFWCFWQRRRFRHGVALTAAALGWVIAGNAVRVLAVALLDGTGRVNLATGLPHELLGAGLFVVMLALVWSTDHALLFAASLVSPAHCRLDDRRQVSTTGGRRSPWPAFAATPLSWRPLTLAFGLLVLVQFFPYALFTGRKPGGEASDPFARYTALTKNALPAQLGDWHQVAFETSDRQREDPVGAHSRTWRYQGKDLEATISLDYPFAGWHDLSACYRGQGWEVEDDSKGNGSQLNLRKLPTEQYGRVLFLVREVRSGKAERPPSLTPLGWWSWEWARLASCRPLLLFGSSASLMGSEPPPTVQVQLRVVTSEPLSASQEQAADAAFRRVVQLLLPEKVVP